MSEFQSYAWRTLHRRLTAQEQQAVALLVQLRALAEHEKRLPAFRARIAAITAQQGRRTALIARMQKAGLLSA